MQHALDSASLLEALIQRGACTLYLPQAPHLWFWNSLRALPASSGFEDFTQGEKV